MKNPKVFKIKLEFLIVANNLWEVWEQIYKSPFTPHRKVEIEHQEDKNDTTN